MLIGKVRHRCCHVSTPCRCEVCYVEVRGEVIAFELFDPLAWVNQLAQMKATFPQNRYKGPYHSTSRSRPSSTVY